MTIATLLAGDGEYESETTLRELADDLGQHLGLDTRLLTSSPVEDMPHFPPHDFGDLAVLEDTDLLIVYVRFRRLPDDQMKALQAYLESGRPVIGLRTSTHAFRFEPGSPWASWNDGFGADVLGSPWISHHGHTSTTVVTREPGIEHPILAGLPAHFRSPSWLYRVRLSPGCVPLLHGTPVSPEEAPTPGPVAWVRERPRAQRVFYTSLGHPADFALEPFRRLLRNAASWCLR